MIFAIFQFFKSFPINWAILVLCASKQNNQPQNWALTRVIKNQFECVCLFLLNSSWGPDVLFYALSMPYGIKLNISNYYTSTHLKEFEWVCLFMFILLLLGLSCPILIWPALCSLCSGTVICFPGTGTKVLVHLTYMKG